MCIMSMKEPTNIEVQGCVFVCARTCASPTQSWVLLICSLSKVVIYHQTFAYLLAPTKTIVGYIVSRKVRSIDLILTKICLLCIVLDFLFFNCYVFQKEERRQVNTSPTLMWVICIYDTYLWYLFVKVRINF